jgi:hypothetical protein
LAGDPGLSQLRLDNDWAFVGSSDTLIKRSLEPEKMAIFAAPSLVFSL